jgi:hypothetical protein
MYDEIFSGYQPRQVSVLSRRFGEHLVHHQGCDDDHRDGPRNVGSIQTPGAADSPRRGFIKSLMMMTEMVPETSV